MIEGEYRIKKRIGEYGFYGHVIVEIEKNNAEGIQVIGFDNREALNNSFVVGMIFGVHYAMDEYRKVTKDYAQYKIKIVKHHGIPVDSNPPVMAFVAAKAVFNALKFENKTEFPQLIGELGQIVFRK